MSGRRRSPRGPAVGCWATRAASTSSHVRSASGASTPRHSWWAGTGPSPPPETSMDRRHTPVPALERVEAIVANPAIYELAALIPDADRTHGGRRRAYPEHMWLIYEALISVYGSARQVEAELSHPLVWTFLAKKI